MAVDNIQGELQCRPAPNAADIPRGGYTSSCQGCRLSRSKEHLRCTHCTTADGRRVGSTYATARCPPPAALDNHDGVLFCSGLRHAAPAGGLPAGGYLHSCQGCAVVEADGAPPQLSCSHCATADRRQRDTALALAECASRRFGNQDGRLVCEGA